jgi:ribonuclease HI
MLRREHLPPVAEAVERVLDTHAYDLSATIDAVDGAIAGPGGLLDPATGRAELRAAAERLVGGAEDPPPAADTGQWDHLDGAALVLYVDGSSRGNPGPAGAGAVVRDADGERIAGLGLPVGARTDNNTAEYAALHLGCHWLLARCTPGELEVRIDSRTVIDDIWGEQGATVDGVDGYRTAITDLLARVPEHEWTHLADSDPNPADALATVGADIAELGPGG